MIRFVYFAFFSLLCTGGGTFARESSVEAQRRDFQEIASQLDAGGELFLVLRAGRWIDRMLDALAKAPDGIAASAPDELEVRAEIERLQRFMSRQGINAFRGIGISSVASVGGRHTFKLFLQRDTVDSSLPFWRGIFGWQPRRLLSLDFVPAGYSMVRAGTFEPATLWQMLSDGMNEASQPATQARFEAVRDALTQWTGIAPEVLFGSLRDEFLVAARFEKAPLDTLSVNGDSLAVPTPSFLVVVGTGEDILRGAVEAQLSQRGIALTESEVAGERMRYAQTPLAEFPFPIQPAFASQPGFFLFGSSPAVVEEALLAYRHRSGLITRPAFKDAFQGASMVNNGIVYIDDEAALILRRWREGRGAVISEEAIDVSPAATRIRKALTAFGGDLPSCALTVQNWRSGVMLMGVTGVGGEAVIRQAWIAVLRLWTQGLNSAARLMPAAQEGL